MNMNFCPLKNKGLLLRYLWQLITILSAVACGTNVESKQMYFHIFTFDAISDAKKYGKPEVKIIDFDYGGSNIFGTVPDKTLPMQPFYSNSVVAPMPRADFLYVKWQVISSGKVYQDRVSLKNILPPDPTDYQIHFFINETQLYIYAFPPFKTTDPLGRTVQHMGQLKSAGGGDFNEVPYNKKFQIYPEVTR